MEYIASGEKADVYKSDSMAIKMFKNNVSYSVIKLEVDLQNLAFDYGLPVPKIFDIIEINGKHGIVMELIKGETLSELIFEDDTKAEDYLNKSIEMQNYLHKIETKKFPDMKVKLKNQILNADKLNERNKEKLILKLNNMVFENKLCHGDFHVLNLIQTTYDVKIIDWICASSGSPYADIYRTYLLYRLFNEDYANLYLNIYYKKYKVEKDKILEWAAIIAGARIGEYVKEEKDELILKEIVMNNL